MSFDRVLPRPAALYDEPTGRINRQTSSLLEHKIMYNPHGLPPVTTVVTDRIDGLPISRPNGSYHHLAEPTNCSTALSQMQILSLNQEKVAQNQIPVRILTTTKQVAPVLADEVSPTDRSTSSSPTKTESAKGSVTQFCLCQPDPKIPRPRNAFILYRQHYQAAVVAQNPGLANPEISKIIGEQWRALPNETKEQWKALAEAEKARHQQQYPDYRYQPRRVGRDSCSRNTSSSISNNPAGATVCNRCGGRLMNPPSAPDTPLTTSGGQISSTRSSQADIASHINSSRGARDAPARPPSPSQLRDDISRRASRQCCWKETDSPSADVKRRRLTSSGIHKPSPQEGSHGMERYSLSSQKTYVSRPGVAYFRSHCESATNGRTNRRLEDDRYYDPSLTLPPLKTSLSSLQNQHDVEATVMTIPVVNKIKVLSKISPPLTNRSTAKNSLPRGAVIAVDGQDPALVNIMLKYLGTLLTKDGKYAVRVFEGPEIRPRQNPPKAGERGDYLNVISVWHRISDEISQFILSKSGSNGTRAVEDSSSPVSPKSIVPRSSRTQVSSPMISSNNGLANGLGQTSVSHAKVPNPVPIALVPRYQLTTADMFACSIPINDSYAPLDHWQWMASLWRGCVGPDVTVHIRECDREELDRHGVGNPVEVRLNDARTLIVRRTPDSAKELEEKALRRVGFEIEDFLTR
ncbi:hypothetical protein VTN77DRAFT_8949 [Rasamsonia byssochlamydoides]|uniref:uncharacterized protein n=1 Tax=Rasamsonia byssochlamydoides TaxID=89139 RepID=UPI003744688C